MAARQPILPFGEQPAIPADRLISSASNAAALSLIARWPHWPGPVIALWGPKGTGRTHHARHWALMADGECLPAARISAHLLAEGARHLAIDDADTIAGDTIREQMLFHVINQCAAQGGSLLLTGVNPPALWQVGIKDLQTRLKALGGARLELPDDSLLTGVLELLFAARQLRPPSELIPYLLTRMERSTTAAEALVAALDAEALERKLALTVDLAARWFIKQGLAGSG